MDVKIKTLEEISIGTLDELYRILKICPVLEGNRVVGLLPERYLEKEK